MQIPENWEIVDGSLRAIHRLNINLDVIGEAHPGLSSGTRFDVFVPK